MLSDVKKNEKKKTQNVHVCFVTHHLKEEHRWAPSHVDDDELPGLELIGDAVVSCHHQVRSAVPGRSCEWWNPLAVGCILKVRIPLKSERDICSAFFHMKDSSLFSLSLTDPAVTYIGSDGAATAETHLTLPPSPSSFLFANPDLIQSEMDAARTSDRDVRNLSRKKAFLSFAKTTLLTIKRCLLVHWRSWICSQEMTTPSPAPSSVTAAHCWPASEAEQHQLRAVTPCSARPPSAVTTLSLHIPELGQCTYCNQDCSRSC